MWFLAFLLVGANIHDEADDIRRVMEAHRSQPMTKGSGAKRGEELSDASVQSALKAASDMEQRVLESQKRVDLFGTDQEKEAAEQHERDAAEFFAGHNMLDVGRLLGTLEGDGKKFLSSESEARKVFAGGKEVQKYQRPIIPKETMPVEPQVEEGPLEKSAESNWGAIDRIRAHGRPFAVL